MDAKLLVIVTDVLEGKNDRGGTQWITAHELIHGLHFLGLYLGLSLTGHTLAGSAPGELNESS